MEIFPGISIDSGVRFSKPCLAGTRIDVGAVVGAWRLAKALRPCKGRTTSLTSKSYRASLRSACSRPCTRGGESGPVKLLLDENFPLPLYYQLRAAGLDVFGK